MQTVMVNASASYPVHIGEGLLDRAGELIADITKSRRCAIVTDSSVGPLYGGRVRDSLEKAGCTVNRYEESGVLFNETAKRVIIVVRLES